VLRIFLLKIDLVLLFDIEFELVPVSNGGGEEFFGISGLFTRNIF